MNHYVPLTLYDSILELIFVYNAGAGWFDKASDFAHKMFSPSTYSCDLCSLTHGHFGPKKAWKAFLEAFSYPVHFYHKDEWEKHHPDAAFSYPIVLLKVGDKLDCLLNKEQLSQINEVDLLIENLNKALLD